MSTLKPIQINTNGRFFYFVTNYGGLDRSKYLDICAVRGRFIVGCILFSLACLIPIVVLYPVVDMIVCLLAGNGFWSAKLPVIVIAYGAALTIGLGIYGINKFGEYLHRRKYGLAPKPPGPIKLMYRSWKEKYCAPVEFVD